MKKWKNERKKTKEKSKKWKNEEKWKMKEKGPLTLIRSCGGYGMDSDTVAETNHSLKSRSFLNRVTDRLRKMLDRSPEDSMQDIDKRTMIWWMFVSSTLEASVFMGKKYSDSLHSINNAGKDLTLKQMFDTSE